MMITIGGVHEFVDLYEHNNHSLSNSLFPPHTHSFPSLFHLYFTAVFPHHRSCVVCDGCTTWVNVGFACFLPLPLVWFCQDWSLNTVAIETLVAWVCLIGLIGFYWGQLLICGFVALCWNLRIWSANGSAFHRQKELSSMQTPTLCVLILIRLLYLCVKNRLRLADIFLKNMLHLSGSLPLTSSCSPL